MDNHFQHYMSWHPVMDDFTPSTVIDQDVLWDVDQDISLDMGAQQFRPSIEEKMASSANDDELQVQVPTRSTSQMVTRAQRKVVSLVLPAYSALPPFNKAQCGAA